MHLEIMSVLELNEKERRPWIEDELVNATEDSECLIYFVTVHVM